MSDKVSVSNGKGASLLVPDERSGSHSSREHSPSPLGNATLDHSMESLLASDSCEEVILGEEMPGNEDIAGLDAQRDKVPEDFSESKFLQETTAQLEERRNDRISKKTGSGKRKKRVSSHRERKISVSGKAAAAKVSR